MASVEEFVADEVVRAIGDAFDIPVAEVDPLIRPSRFADLQVNAAFGLAKRLRRPPSDIADAIRQRLLAQAAGTFADVEVSGGGFLNIRLDDDWIAAQVALIAADPRCGVPLEAPRTIPIDYSAPNVAKEMHVGHLRTTVVGDCLARTLEHLGHRVIRQNHIGDWGTPFGMLIEHLIDVGETSPEAEQLDADPNAFYQAARRSFDADAGFADRARHRVVLLQAGDERTLRLWDALVARSVRYFDRVYALLGVTLTDDDLAGESSYNVGLAGICDELERRDIAVVSDGALCVFLDGYTGRDGRPLPLIIRKSDGGYGYATTDLATVRRRVDVLGGDRLVYVVGATQALHLEMVWATARLAGWLPDTVETAHVRIGSVLGEDHKLLRTRSGAPLRLLALLQEAVDRSRAMLESERPEGSGEEREALATAIGIGAVKWADLSVAHDTDYVFDLDRMLSLTGDTGPYLQYAVTRIRSIFRSAGVDAAASRSAALLVREPTERALALELLSFGPTVAEVGRTLEPHRLCASLFVLAQAFSAFYEACAVLQAEPEVRASRLALCATTEAALTDGLRLLGIETPDRM